MVCSYEKNGRGYSFSQGQGFKLEELKKTHVCFKVFVPSEKCSTHVVVDVCRTSWTTSQCLQRIPQQVGMDLQIQHTQLWSWWMLSILKSSQRQTSQRLKISWRMLAEFWESLSQAWIWLPPPSAISICFLYICSLQFAFLWGQFFVVERKSNFELWGFTKHCWWQNHGPECPSWHDSDRDARWWTSQHWRLGDNSHFVFVQRFKALPGAFGFESQGWFQAWFTMFPDQEGVHTAEPNDLLTTCSLFFVEM